MPTVELYVDAATLLWNGYIPKRGEKEEPMDLVLAAKWFQPNARYGSRSEPAKAAFAMAGVKSGEPEPFRTDNESGIERNKRRLFKMDVVGDSDIQFTLLDRRALGGAEKAILNVIKSAIITGVTGGAGAVVGAVSQTALNELFAFEDEWEYTLGTAHIFVPGDDPAANLGSIQLELTDAIKEEIRNRPLGEISHATRDTAVSTRRQLPGRIANFLKNNNTNGHIDFSANVYP